MGTAQRVERIPAGQISGLRNSHCRQPSSSRAGSAISPSNGESRMMKSTYEPPSSGSSAIHARWRLVRVRTPPVCERFLRLYAGVGAEHPRLGDRSPAPREIAWRIAMDLDQVGTGRHGDVRAQPVRAVGFGRHHGRELCLEIGREHAGDQDLSTGNVELPDGARGPRAGFLLAQVAEDEAHHVPIVLVQGQGHHGAPADELVGRDLPMPSHPYLSQFGCREAAQASGGDPEQASRLFDAEIETFACHVHLHPSPLVNVGSAAWRATACGRRDPRHAAARVAQRGYSGGNWLGSRGVPDCRAGGRSRIACQRSSPCQYWPLSL